jgi:hypothetical protein
MADYSADDVDWLRPPEVEGQNEDWRSRWLLSTFRSPGAGLTTPPELHADLLSGELLDVGGSEVRLDLQTRSHPLDPEGYPVVDEVLRWLDARLGLVEINGSHRDKWRTFR